MWFFPHLGDIFINHAMLFLGFLDKTIKLKAATTFSFPVFLKNHLGFQINLTCSLAFIAHILMYKGNTAR